jgi:tetratricopeptide (TPR) repeat protein
MRLEAAGRHEEALTLYKNLYARDPVNMVVYNRLKAAYLRTGKLDQAETLIRSRLETTPDAPILIIELAQVIYRSGRHETALKMWNEQLELHPRQTSLYQAIANIMVQERRIDDAIEIYLKGRKNTGTQNLFVFSLANLYAARNEYGRAAEELINHLKIQPQQAGLVESYLLRYPASRNVIIEVEEILVEAIEDRPKEPGLKRILANLYMKAGLYKKAFRATRELEAVMDKKHQGEALFRYAEEVFRNGRLNDAEAAYQMIIDKYPNFRHAPKAYLGLARILESEDQFDKAAEMYGQIAELFSGRIAGREALFRLGKIQLGILNNGPDAMNTLKKLTTQYSGSSEARDAQQLIGESLIQLGNSRDAEAHYRALVEKEEKKRGQYWVRALVGLSKLYYYLGRFEDALAELSALDDGPVIDESIQDTMLNDALKLKLFISEYSQLNPSGLRMFSRAQLLVKQGAHKAATRSLDSLITLHPEKPLAAYGLMERGLGFLSRKAYKAAIADFDSLNKQFPGSYQADQALERAGFAFEKLRQDRQAIDRYEALLLRNSRSYLAGLVRERIRKIEEKGK